MASGKGGSRSGSSDAKDRQGAGPESLPPREVRVAHAETASLARTVAVTGTLAADEQAELGPKVAGRLATIAVDLGDNVRKGQVLARLSPTDFDLRVRQSQNALDQARAQLGLPPDGPLRAVDPQETALVKQASANLTQARLTRDRMSRLFEQQLIPQQDLDAAEAAFQVAEGRHQEAIETARTRQALVGQRLSELQIAQQQRSDSILVAPFDGRIRERRASIGDYIAVGQPVLVLVRVHPLRLRLDVPEREAVGIRAGQPVELTVEGEPEPHTGRVARISPALSEESRTLLVEAEVPNPSGRLRPGTFAKAEIVTQAGEPAVLVPASAVISFAGVDKVLGVEDGKAVEKRVRTGRRAGDRVEILEGAAAGDTVVVEPGNLVDGQPVTVVP
ncbi:MAG: efflux RND transporter periplasmic adaptor subunit [Acidobacteriota bacterium]